MIDPQRRAELMADIDWFLHPKIMSTKPYFLRAIRIARALREMIEEPTVSVDPLDDIQIAEILANPGSHAGSDWERRLIATIGVLAAAKREAFQTNGDEHYFPLAEAEIVEPSLSTDRVGEKGTLPEDDDRTPAQMIAAVRQPLDGHPALADKVAYLAHYMRGISLVTWCEFLAELNSALAAPAKPPEGEVR